MILILKKYKMKIIEYLKFNAIGITNFVISQMIYISLYLFLEIVFLLYIK